MMHIKACTCCKWNVSIRMVTTVLTSAFFFIPVIYLDKENSTFYDFFKGKQSKYHVVARTTILWKISFGVFLPQLYWPSGWNILGSGAVSCIVRWWTISPVPTQLMPLAPPTHHIVKTKTVPTICCMSPGGAKLPQSRNTNLNQQKCTLFVSFSKEQLYIKSCPSFRNTST